MKIVSLKLKNIRSYKQALVDFPEGLVLLAGDIGSGKSTLLLAIEFALFGLRRGEISGSSLLRHGAKEGTVVLTLQLNGDTVAIQRGLKRTATSVGQGPGKITINDVATDMTAVELRSKVLELLNYPESLLSQTKSLVFRYTVYTPQEDMKSILFEKPEERLDTMRKLFSIDKYKLIRENAAILGRELRTRIERLRGQADELPGLKKEQKELLVREKASAEEGEKLTKNLEEKKQALDTQRARLEKLEAVAKERERTAKEHAVVTEQLHNARNNLQRTQQEIHALTQEKSVDENALSQRKKELADKLAQTDERQKELQEKIATNTRNEGTIDAKAEQIMNDKKNIHDLDSCPTCKQPVDDDHKHAFAREADVKLKKISEKKKAIVDVLARLAKERDEIRAEQQAIMKEADDLKRQELQHEQHKKNELLRKQKQEREQELTKQITALEKQRVDLEKRITKDFDTKKYDEQRNVTRTTDEHYQQARLAHARHAEQMNALTERTKKLTQTIIEKQTAATRADELAAQHEWLTKHFSNLMFTIEKHVLMTLYHQFNDAFKEWFDALIEDDTLSVRLDHDFTPLVEQNGYETMIENLSGGEKTSVALAYRLAINKVINHALQDLHTDGLLILDEPTDGFSSEQLDRVQEVLSNLGLQQILIVSHEPKMESFMDHVIRVTKNEHESAVHT